jgi:hypothetical protein
MQLPHFKAQAGVSMDSARVSAARVAAPPMVQARQQKFRPTMSVEQAMQQSSQPSGMDKALAIGAQLIDYAIEVDNARQDMSLKAAQAEYKNHMAYWMADFQQSAYEIGEDGRANWETYEDQYLKASEQAKTMFRDKYRFKGKEREAEWKFNTQGADTSHRVNILQFTTKETERVALAEWKVAEANASKLSELQSINAAAVKSGTILAVQAEESERQFRVSESFKMEARSLDTMSLAQAAATREDMLYQYSDNAKQYTDTMRKSMEGAAKGRIGIIWRDGLQAAWEDSGEIGAANFIANLQAGGVERSMLRDQVEHDSLVNTLQSQLGNLKQQKKDLADSQGALTAANSWWTGSGNDYALRSAAEKNPQVKKAINEDAYNRIAAMRETPEGLASPEGAHMMVRAAQSNLTPDALNVELENVLFNTSPDNPNGIKQMTGVLAGMQAAEQHNPRVWDGLNKSAMEKYEFLKAAQEDGRLSLGNPESLQRTEQEYREFKNMDDGERKRRADRAKNMLDPSFSEFGLKGEDVATRFKRQAEAKGHDSSSWFASNTQVSMEADGVFRDNFARYYEMTNNAGAAEKLAYEAVRREFGTTLITGERTLERNSPELMMALPPEVIQGYHEEKITGLNEVRALGGLPPIESSDTRRRYVGKEPSKGDPTVMAHTYVLTDTNNAYIKQPDPNSPMSGKLLNVKIQYPTTDPKAAVKEDILNQQDKFRRVENIQDSVLTKSGVHLPRNGTRLEMEYMSGASRMDVTEHPRPRTPSYFAEVNQYQWGRMDDDDKAEATSQYQDVYKTLMDLARNHYYAGTGTGFNETEADYMVRHYMFSRGYMEGDTDGVLIIPPEMH